MKCAKIDTTVTDMALFVSLKDLANGLEWTVGKACEDLRIGDKIEIEVVEMTQQELDNLPDFDG